MEKLKSEEGGYDYFENLPDDLVILIFTKLSSSKGNTTLDDIKSLGRSSQVSKRFNALTCLVPTLTIHDFTIPTLYEYCPKILNKFKHIRSLRIGFVICSIKSLDLLDIHQILHWEATISEPHKYYVAVVSCTDATFYEDLHCRQSLMIASDSANKDLYLTRLYSMTLFNFSHMLISSIKDHKFLRSVVLADFLHLRCTLTLDEDILVKLRNCGSTDLEKVDGCMKSGSVANMDIPVKGDISAGIMMNNVCFSITKKWKKSMDDCNDIHKDDDDFKVKDYNPLNMALYKMLENPEAASLKVDDKVVHSNLLLLKSDGNLF